ncbi:MAG: 3-oxo-tetronate kinase [Devosia sp.]
MLLGAIADDLTGATDLSLMLARNGMQTLQYVGLPESNADFGDADAVVVALKTRTVPPAEAVARSVDAARVLLANGAEQLLFKYCSTFDSTDQGNIGPVAEALLEVTGAPIAIACPAFPATARSIYQGHLFVGTALLSESSMKDHPLTPMRDANLVRVLQRQSKGSVGLLPWQVVAQGPEAVREALASAQSAGHKLMIADAIRDEDLRILGEALAGARLITGGSGIGMGLPDNFRREGRIHSRSLPSRMTAPAGRCVVLAGSCSAATREQVRTAIEAGFPSLKIVPLEVAAGKQTALQIGRWVMANSTGWPAVVYSSDDPEAVRLVQEKLGRERAGTLVERLLADVSVILKDAGFSRFIVAGGETSGAVVEALGARGLQIGPEIAPGVPWTRSVGGADLVLALKSGNFGAPSFFLDALDLLDD